MFYIGISHGLGNQMFQYAFGVAASMESNVPLALDISKYDYQFGRDTKREFLLHHFNIQTPIAPNEATAKFHKKLPVLIRRIKNKLHPKNSYVFDPGELRVKDEKYYEGYWQTEKYFKKYEKTIRTELTLKNPLGMEAQKAMEEIRECQRQGIETICIHVRRGDLITNKHAGAAFESKGTEYFRKGIEVIDAKSDKPKHIFIATDDIEWVKKNIKPHHSFSYLARPGIYDFEELMLMSTCDHFVIANSSFSWWAAWLGHNPNKIVIAPIAWLRDPSIPTTHVVPEEWIRI